MDNAAIKSDMWCAFTRQDVTLRGAGDKPGLGN
jgi:hypothetical protein